jgi:hypothetical protein
LASAIAGATNQTVVASVYKVSFDVGAARCGWENYFKDFRKHGFYTWYSYTPDGSQTPVSYFWISTQ